jgi:hypothetical protein
MVWNNERDRRANGAGRESRFSGGYGAARSILAVGVGLALGIPGAIGAGHLMGSQLFGVIPWDPLMLSGAALLLVLAALTAAVIPARRATRVGPMIRAAIRIILRRQRVALPRKNFAQFLGDRCGMTRK